MFIDFTFYALIPKQGRMGNFYLNNDSCFWKILFVLIFFFSGTGQGMVFGITLTKDAVTSALHICTGEPLNSIELHSHFSCNHVGLLPPRELNYFYINHGEQRVFSICSHHTCLS